jgi:hypothetical protein
MLSLVVLTALVTFRRGEAPWPAFAPVAGIAEADRHGYPRG